MTIGEVLGIVVAILTGITALIKALSSADAKAFKNLQTVVKELENRLNDEKAENDQLRADLKVYKETLEKMQKEMVALWNENKQLRAENEEKEKQIRKLSDKVRAMEKATAPLKK